MTKLVMSKYTVLTNKPFNKEYSGGYYEMVFYLPQWFTNWNKNKLIKVYGCSFIYLESENKVPKPSTKYTGQFISVHSNIAQNDTVNLNSVYMIKDYFPDSKTPLDESATNANYMMVVNNYYTPKIYDLTDTQFGYITISFKDTEGQAIPIRTSYSREDDHLGEIYQAWFKIECELAILE
jgi:hypothetical protein